MRGRALASVAAVSLTAVLAACGGESSSSSGASCSPGSSGVNLGTAVATVNATDNLAFTPTTANAGVGQVVQWTNTGSTQHTVTFESAGASCLSDVSLQGGAQWQVKFNQAGTYSYHCTIHPQMTGTITVS